MGYRKLLKDYIEHVRNTVGSDLVELAYYRKVLTKREIGELRAIRAELKRESAAANQLEGVDTRLEDVDLSALDKLPLHLNGGPDDLDPEQVEQVLRVLLDAEDEAEQRS